MSINVESRKGGQYITASITGSGGGGKGGGNPRVPVEAADSLHNTAYAAILDVIGNGEMSGPVHPDAPLCDIYLDGTPIQNADGSLNFERVQVDYRVGTVDQESIPGFPASSNVTQVGVLVKKDAPFVQTISNPELSAVRVSLHVPRLMKMIESGGNAGDRVGHKVDYAIDIKVSSGTFAQVLAGSFNGKTTTGYTRTHRIELPRGAQSWTLRVRRLTDHSSTSAIEDNLYVQSWAQVIDGRFRHPMTALVGIKIDAEQFQAIPTHAYHWRGQVIRVPSNYNPATREYSGAWDGTFKRAWSNNPAWVYYDMLTNRLYGLGGRIDAAMIDRYALYQIGAYYDQMVPDGQGGTEPRFVCNVYLQSQADALRVLNDLSSVFRGMAYWANGQVVAVSDAPSDPVYTYTNANVVDGRFEYSGADLNTLKTVALVSYNDPTDFYRAKVEVVEDAEGIRRYGIRKTEVVAFGCTSRGQAQRVGLYHLYTSRMETGTVAFSVGLDGVIPQPGSIIKIADRNRAGRHIGGRIKFATKTQVTLDRDHPAKVGDTLTVNLPDGTAQSRPVVVVAGRKVTVAPALSVKPAPESAWAIDADDLVTQHVRVVSVAEKDGITFAVSGILHHPGKYTAIDNNVRLEPLPVSVVPPRAQAAPSNIQITQYHRYHQGITRSTAEITWDAPEHAVRFDVQWRRDNGSWVRLPRTSGNLVELTDLNAGTYQVRVRAINTLNVLSLWAHASADLDGLADTPPVLEALTATGQVMAIRLDWTYLNTPNIIERVQIRAGQSSNFTDSYVLTELAYPATSYNIHGLGYATEMWFWARLLDKNNMPGAWFPDNTGAGIFGQPTQDAQTVLDYLQGQINESQLAQSLVEKIDHIDGDGDGSVNQRLNTRFGLVDTQFLDVIDQISDEIAQRIQGDNAVQTLVTNETNARVSGDDANATSISAEASRINGLLARMPSGTGKVATEASVQTKASTTALNTLEGKLSAEWGTKLQVRSDGRVVQTGVMMGASIGSNGTSRSEILMMANKIAFLNTLNGQLHTPFVFDVANDTALLNSVMIGNASITNAKIQNGAITAVKIKDGDITNAKIKNGAITTAKIKDGDITNVKIANGAITTAKIGNAQIKTANIGVAEIDTLRIKNNAITIHTHAYAAKGNYNKNHNVTCSISLASAARLSIFVKVGIDDANINSGLLIKQAIRLNNSVIYSYTPVIFKVGIGNGSGESGYSPETSLMGNDMHMVKVDVEQGTHTISAGLFNTNTNNTIYFPSRSLLVMASMR